MDRLTLYGSFTSSSSYKPMLYLALARLPFSFRTVNLKTGAQKTPEYLAINRWGVVPSLRHRGLTILQSNVILDYLARETGHFEGRTEQISCSAQAGRSGAGFATGGSVPWCPRLGASPRPSETKASEYWIFCRVLLMSCPSYLPLSIVRAFGPRFRLDLSVAPPFSLGVPH